MTQTRLKDSEFPDCPRAVTAMISTPSVSKADRQRVGFPLSTRRRVLATGCLAIFILVLFGGSVCGAQGTYTAASCNRSDVNAVINGPTHKAVNGDTIIIPTTGSPCIWTTGIAINGVGIDITGTGTPNTGGGTVGAGTPNTTIIDNVPNSSPYWGALFSFTGLTFGQTAQVELLTLSAAGGAANSVTHGPINFSGTCTTGGCAQIRVDNINYTAGTWENVLAGSGMVTVANVFGVVDHNTTTENQSDSPPLVQIAFPSWQGVGDWGDNSFASADTFGTAQAMFMENNSLSGVRLSENDVPPYGTNPGGARYVCRFNTIAQMSGTGICSAHGTAWGGRFRGQRQVESYYNSVTIGSGGCNAIAGLLSGTGYYFSNTVDDSVETCNEFINLDVARLIMTGTPWNKCDGTEPWDQFPWSSTTQCLDQPGHGVGALLEGATPLLAGLSCLLPGQCWPNPALDPVYEAGDKVTGGANPYAYIQVQGDGSATRLLSNRDYYAEVSTMAQTSTSSPFNGTIGTGFGTLAHRPTTCTTGVGYWATDQGNWNAYNSAQEGELFVCASTNTWTMKYEPYTYPHPLTAGGTTTGGNPNPPTSLTATVE
jgi:hypothetical protein